MPYQFAIPVAIQNCTRGAVTKVDPKLDDDEPNALVSYEPRSPSGKVYGPPGSNNYGTGPWVIRVTDNPATCQGLNTKAAPTGFHDIFEITSPAVTGALTAMLAAMDGAAGNRATKRTAAEDSLLATGVLGPGLAKQAA